MSTRYVWNKYDTIWVAGAEQNCGTSVPAPPTSAGGGDNVAQFSEEEYNEVQFDQTTGLFVLARGRVNSENLSSLYDDESIVAIRDYPCFIIRDDTTESRHSRELYYAKDWYRNDYWKYRTRNGGEIEHSSAYGYVIYKKTAELGKGSLEGVVSSGISSNYPNDNTQGSYWYTYQGADSIDPASVSLPSAIMPSQQITITVTPGTGKVYGGTVSYQYQVRLNGGAWQTVATTTATTRGYNVPAGTQSIQARVVASDNMGFTSDTYVSSAAVTVVGAPASITVPGAAMTGQTYEVLWDAVTNVDSYKLERRVNSGSWTTVYTGPGLSYTDTAVAGWSSVQYRVSAGIDGVYGDPVTSSEVDIISAASLVISGADGSLGTITAPVTYSVTSDTGNQITVTETINGHSRTLNPASGAQIAIPVSMIDPAADDTGEITIQASVRATSGTVTQTRNWTYTKTPLTLPTKAYRVEQLQGGAKDVMPLTLAEAVMLPDGSSVADYVNTPTVFAAKTTQNSITMPFTPSMVVFSSLETSRGYGQNVYLVYQGDSFLDGYSWRITLSGNTISKSGGSDGVNGMKIIAFA